MVTSLHLQFVNQIAILSIDQMGSKVNVLSTPFWNEFHEKLKSLSDRNDLFGLIVQSTKPGIFIAGADLKELANASPDNPTLTREFLDLGNRVLRLLESLPFPTVALIDGVCLGGGFEVALVCDFRLGGTNPKFQMGFPEVFLGLIPGWGGTQRLGRLIGPFEALQRIACGTNYDSDAAKTSGIVLDIVSSDQLLPRAMEIIETSRSNQSWRNERRRKHEPYHDSIENRLGPDGNKMLLQQMRDSMDQLPGAPRGPSMELIDVLFLGTQLPFEEGLKLETQAFLRLAGGPESKQMIEDFFAKRKK
jgi:enoyl-CoA hydratase